MAKYQWYLEVKYSQHVKHTCSDVRDATTSQSISYLLSLTLVVLQSWFQMLPFSPIAS